MDAALDAVRAELAAHTPALTLSGAWSRSCGTASRPRSGWRPRQPWTWYLSGSVARGEAAPGSDVETMAVLHDDVDDATKTALLARAAEVHAVLDHCGIRGDTNGVLASRPRFCRRMRSWAEGRAVDRRSGRRPRR